MNILMDITFCSNWGSKVNLLYKVNYVKLYTLEGK